MGFRVVVWRGALVHNHHISRRVHGKGLWVPRPCSSPVLWWDGRVWFSYFSSCVVYESAFQEELKFVWSSVSIRQSQDGDGCRCSGVNVVTGGQPKNNDNKIWLFTFSIWGAGAAVIYFLWNTRVFVSDSAEGAFGFVLYIVAFFYFLALGPIRNVISGWFEVKPEDRND